MTPKTLSERYAAAYGTFLAAAKITQERLTFIRQLESGAHKDIFIEELMDSLAVLARKAEAYLESDEDKSKSDAIGICTRCGEYTSLIDSCCGAAIHFEGGFVRPDEIEDEEKEIA